MVTMDRGSHWKHKHVSVCRCLIIHSRRKRQLSPSFFSTAGMCTHLTLGFIAGLTPALGRKLVVAVIACGTLSGNVPREGKRDRVCGIRFSLVQYFTFEHETWNLRVYSLFWKDVNRQMSPLERFNISSWVRFALITYEKCFTCNFIIKNS